MADHEDSSGRHLAAAGGLSAVVHGDTVRIGWAGHDDWFGPGRFRIGDRDMTLADPRSIHGVDDLGEWTASIWLADRTASPRIDASLAAYQDQPLMVFSLRAPVGVDDGLSTGEFGSPCVSWPVFDPVERIPGGVPEDASAFGYQYMEFALPTASDAGFAAWTFWPFRPSVVMPLMCLSDSGCAAARSARPVPRAGHRRSARRRARRRWCPLRLARGPELGAEGLQHRVRGRGRNRRP